MNVAFARVKKSDSKMAMSEFANSGNKMDNFLTNQNAGINIIGAGNITTMFWLYSGKSSTDNNLSIFW